jgi:GxxExxY protein
LWGSAHHFEAMARGELFEERLTHSVIGTFFEVYNTLGFGFLEHIYVMALERELIEREHRVAREVAVRVSYKGHELGAQRLDMIVDDKLVVETKSTHELHKAARRQVYNYLRSTNLEIGLLLHFGPEAHFYRMIYRYQRRNPINPLNPLHPDETSVSVASDPQAVTKVDTAGGPEPPLSLSSCLKNT